jgi:hypothetical protein
MDGECSLKGFSGSTGQSLFLFLEVGGANAMHSSIKVWWGLSHTPPGRLLTLTPNLFFFSPDLSVT